MKKLIVYYSRTGTTKKVAEILSVKMQADLVEVIDMQDRSGLSGYVRSGYEAVMKKSVPIKPLGRDLSSYDLIIVGTPVWAGTMSTPIRTFLQENRDSIKRVAFFCTMGGSGDQTTFSQMNFLVKKGSDENLTLLTKEVINNNYEEKINSFIKKYAE